jgi:hypothetical protein
MKKAVLFLNLAFSCIALGQTQQAREDSIINIIKTNFSKEQIDTFFSIRVVDETHNWIDEKTGNLTLDQKFRTYVFWKTNDGYFIKKIDANTIYNKVKIEEETKLFDFVSRNIKEIQNETIKSNLQKIDGELMEVASTDVRYVLFDFNIKDIVFTKTFVEFDLETSEDSPNYNYNDNQNLKIIQLYNLLVMITSEFEKLQLFKK